MTQPLQRLIDRLVHGSLAGMVVFWLGALWFACGAGVPLWWLPVAFAVGWLIPSRPWPQPDLVVRRRQAGGDLAMAACLPRWLRYAGIVVVGLALAAVAYGAVATPSRHWDGAASFDAKVFWLVRTPTLAQPFFAEAGVFHHSPDYPLLQALLVACSERLLGHGLGRLVLPALLLLLLGVVADTLRRRACDARLVTCTVLAVCLLPALLGPGSGAADSGHSEVLLLVATTTMAAGLLLRRESTLGLGIVLAIASKPEGLPYGLAAALVAFACGERRLAATALAALAVGIGAWLPVQRRLLHLPADGDAAVVLLGMATLAGVGAVAAAVDVLARRCRHPGRVRWAAGLGLPCIGLVCLPFLASTLPAGNSVLGVYLRQSGQLWQRLGELPAYALALLDFAVLRLHVGATFVLPLVAALALRAQRQQRPEPVLCAFVLVGLATSVVPFLLSPEPDLQHYLRSSLPRQLLHWVGPAWLLSACWTQAALLAPRASNVTSPAQT